MYRECIEMSFILGFMNIRHIEAERLVKTEAMAKAKTSDPRVTLI